jgi:hypothetical protein
VDVECGCRCGVSGVEFKVSGVEFKVSGVKWYVRISLEGVGKMRRRG